MIRVDRGAEPPDLARIRSREVARVATIAATRPPTKDEIGDAFAVFRPVLLERQFFKCAYCELKEQVKRNDVEHFRPKARAERGPGLPDHGYWWLAWTWENLLFACRNCNQPPAKSDRFPLKAGSIPLQPPEQPPGQEQALLLDPCVDDPLDHLHFVPELHLGQKRWVPRARNGSERGLVTIRTLRLDDAENLITLYNDHVTRCVEPARDEINEALHSEEAPRIRRTWIREASRLLAPGMPLVALSRDALDHYFPLAVRLQWGLPLEALREELFRSALTKRGVQTPPL